MMVGGTVGASVAAARVPEVYYGTTSVDFVDDFGNDFFDLVMPEPRAHPLPISVFDAFAVRIIVEHLWGVPGTCGRSANSSAPGKNSAVIRYNSHQID